MMRWAGLHHSPALLLPSFFLVLLLFSCGLLSLATAESSSFIIPTERHYTLQAEQLIGGLDDEGLQPTLISAVDDVRISLPIKKGAAPSWEGDDEDVEIDGDVMETLTFVEDADPIWYYVLRRRGFDQLDWSGCGGNWRPEWSRMPSDSAVEDAATAQLFAALRHYFAHHVVCTHSSVSFCGATQRRSAERQFQWAAQYISTLTSTPLSWTDATPRNMRPSGMLLTDPATPSRWCSYHLVYHDTLCTQHVSPLLNGGRSGRGVQEGLPRGIFKAVMPSFASFFQSPFHHFTIKGQQRRVRNADGSVRLELHVTTRMSMVTTLPEELKTLAQVWKRELPHYVTEGRLKVSIGPGGLPSNLLEALAAAGVPPQQLKVKEASVAAPTVASATQGRNPEVHYDVINHGKDHGYVEVYLQPSVETLRKQTGVLDAESEAPGAGPDDATSTFVPAVNDTVHCLLFFPLHLLRPSLYNMESLLGTSTIRAAHTDISSNTLAVLVETKLTPIHIAAYDAAYRRTSQPSGSGAASNGILLARMRLFYGWTHLSEMPPDDNSYRLMPQPIAVLTRPRATASATARTENAAVEVDCKAHHSDIAQLDHQRSLALMLQFLNISSEANEANSLAPSSCVYWLRSTAASGTFIPGPDGAMVFNALSLGLLFTAITAGVVIRLMRRFTCRFEDLEKVVIEEFGKTIDQ